MDFPERLVEWADIARGVGELVVDEAKLAFRAVFRMPREGLSSHFKEPSVPNPIHLNRWEDEEYQLFDPDEAA